MKILITGDREWTNWALMKQTLSAYPPNTILIEGDARGADKMSRIIGDALGLKGPDGQTRPTYPADWTKHKKAAGPIRNRKMYDVEQPDLVLAFHDDLASSKGTRDMVTYAESKGCTVQLITQRGIFHSPIICKACKSVIFGQQCACQANNLLF